MKVKCLRAASAKETLIYWLRGRDPALRGARKLAYLHDMFRFMCSVRLVFCSTRRINQRFPKPSIYYTGHFSGNPDASWFRQAKL